MKNFQKVQQTFESCLEKELDLIPEYFQEMLRYAIDGGKRLRPVICLDIFEATSKQYATTQRLFNPQLLALATEWIHTASLIVDDLPSMDNDSTRRGRNTVHVRFGEARAQELQMFLIAKSLEYVRHESLPLEFQNFQNLNLIQNKFLSVFHNLGVEGSPQGQLLDIQSNPDWKTVIEKKTGTFFEVAFVFGYLSGGGDLSKIDKIKSSALLLGTLYQMIDDYQDQAEDALKQNCINSFLILGEENAISEYYTIENQLIKQLRELGIWTPVLKEILTFLKLRLP